MKNFLLLLSILFTVTINAQYQGSIPEITTGYGSFGMYANDTLITIENTTVPSNVLADRTVSIFYSKAITLPAPTIMIAPGWGQFLPDIFEHLIDFIVSKGCVVVHAPTQSNGGSWFSNHYSGMQMAVDNYSNIIDTTRIGIFGHSVGGGAVSWLGKKFFMDKNYGLNGRFMFASSPWINFEITQTDLLNFPQDVAFITQFFEEDTGFVSPNGTDPRYGIDIYNNINIPASEKDFIMVNSSDVSGYHYTTDHGIYSNAPYDALDFYGLFKHIDALIDYKFNGNCAAKYVCLGNGGLAQIDMGEMNPLTVNEDIVILPQSHYDYPCNAAGNPRSAYCTDVLQVEPFIDYIDSVLVNEQSCSVLDTGIFTSVFSNQHSCDSFVTIYTSLLQSEDTTLYFTSCDITDTIIDVVIYNATNTCDSVVTESTSPLSSSDTTFFNLESTNVMDTGTVVTTLENLYGCDSVVVINTYWTGPIAIHNMTNSLFVVGNPINEILKIECSENILFIELIDLNGRVVLKEHNTFSTIEISHLNKSIYFLKIHLEKDIYLFKILVE